MLFPSEAVLAERRRLLGTLPKKKSPSVADMKHLLDLDPDDDVTLVLLASMLADSGDYAGAADCFWRAIDAQPCGPAAYVGLSNIPGPYLGSPELALGLSELGLRKVMLDRRAMEDIDQDANRLGPLGRAENLNRLADNLGDRRDSEPAIVTERLHPYRLLHQLQEGIDIDDQLVDDLIACGDTVTRLLVGVLRAWARDYLPFEHEGLAEAALAILGEIGDVNTIPYLLEVAALEHPMLSGAAGWALDRICAQRTKEAVELLAELAPISGIGQRMVILERVVRQPKMDSSGLILAQLGEELKRIGRKDLEDYFPTLVNVMLVARGKQGSVLARTLLRQNSSLLSRDTRAFVEEVIESFEQNPFPAPSPPPPSPYSVYDICAGEVIWDEEDDVEDEDPLDPFDLGDEYNDVNFPPPPPVHIDPKPGRNDPCWCGSGKKYKKCHLNSEESPAAPVVEDSFDPLRRGVGDLLAGLSRRESRLGVTEFYGDGGPDGEDEMPFVDWAVHDWIVPSLGRTIVEEFLRRRGPSLSAREREVLNDWASSSVALYETEDIKVGSGVTLKNLITSESRFVHDISMSNALVRWDGILIRVVEGSRGLECTGAGLVVPRPQLNAMLDWMNEDYQRSGLDWTEYRKREYPRIRRQPGLLVQKWRKSIRMSNNDGDEIVMSKTKYRIVDRNELIRSLDRAFEADEAGLRYSWLSGTEADETRTQLGTLTIENGQLTLECNSKERLQKGKKMVTAQIGSAVKRIGDEFLTQAEMLDRSEEARGGPKAPATNNMPPEIERQAVNQLLEKHYSQWPDVPLPALDGKTPRQAAKSPKGKQKLTVLLRDFENSSEQQRKQGKPAYDFSRLRTELGLTDSGA